MSRKYSFEEVKAEFTKRGFTLLDTEYVGTQKPMNCVCSCGAVTRLCLNNLKNGRRCRLCGSERAASKLQQYSFEAVAENYANHGLELLTYSSTQQPLDYICSCGRLTSVIATTKFLLQPIKCKFCRSVAASVATRGRYAYQTFRQVVLTRDGYSCTQCHVTENLHVHHIVGWDVAPELRFEPDNGITLCGSCHRYRHIEEQT